VLGEGLRVDALFQISCAAHVARSLEYRRIGIWRTWIPLLLHTPLQYEEKLNAMPSAYPSPMCAVVDCLSPLLLTLLLVICRPLSTFQPDAARPIKAAAHLRINYQVELR